MLPYFILVGVISIILIGVAYILGKRSSNSKDIERDLQLLTHSNEEIKGRCAEKDIKIENMLEELRRLTSERDVERNKCATLRQQIESAESAHSRYTEELNNRYNKELADIKQYYEEQLHTLKATSTELVESVKEMSKKQVESQLTLIREQMQSTSEKVLKARQAELGEQNIEQVSKIVDPLRESLRLMREALDSSQKEHHDSIVRLDATIKANMENSAQLGETAERLANALTGKVKLQGNFGELQLTKLLEDMGLTEGTHYTTQRALADEMGKKILSDDDKRLMPDFVLHFPNNRDVIVDSKVNITAYTEYMNSNDINEKNKYLNAHIAGVRAQVDGLAKKDYSKYLKTKYTKLNFVIMYMFHEGALNLALLNDHTLWKYAYDKGVLITGPQTMFMNLRVLELMWTQMRQLSNQTEMMTQANLIVQRTQDFVERFGAVKKSMEDTVDKIKKLDITTADSGMSIIRAARELIKCGAKESPNKVKLADIFVDDEPLLERHNSESNNTPTIEHSIKTGETE